MVLRLVLLLASMLASMLASIPVVCLDVWMLGSCWTAAGFAVHACFDAARLQEIVLLKVIFSSMLGRLDV
jgi:hypothetical protein